ncbi:DUF6801 domain-containing protein [Actinosynnema mirum]|uniref:DUF6801 domain-containing protein n=1 Tax=Actinosynnema mirum (strain ATCC 29888 / DSM 43827 / JCM 3225 / NBRC 14064 / NCIMB 13271 / NRRL B-12336 / IMRU 3971 / 101) TaxID=446462 RepID=C6WH32_ACTMD|nr:DUF6801 domain-containing protein [Actinosynnema mirum]ACU36100.1 hypothetical protein Amir_2155 [Actinosynnema mirum DSM 43827]
MLKQSSTARRVVGGLAAGVAVAGSVAFAGAGTGLAATASLTLVYNCPFPLIGAQDMSVRITTTNLPDSAVVGQPTPATNVTAVATVPATATLGLSLVGAKTVQGTAIANTSINNAGTTQGVVANMTIPSTAVPSSGSFNTTATGSTPPVTFSKAGTTIITVGNFSTTLTPRKADGSLTGLGTFTSNCTLKAGQQTELHRFQVSAAGVQVAQREAPAVSKGSSSDSDEEPARPAFHAQSPAPEAAQDDPLPPLRLDFGVTGASSIKKLGSSLPLGPGTLGADVDLATGTFTGDLALPDAKGEFSLFGFLPAKATVRLIPRGPTTGVISEGAVTATTKVDIKLTDVRVLGIPVVGGPLLNCTTTEPSTVTLSSGPGFDPLLGGPLSGDYRIAPFSGCGLATVIVNGTIPGDGNTLALDIARA